MTSIQTKWNISDNQKKNLTENLVSELKLLRAKANITQNDIATLIGISRQSYCQIENGSKEMPWNVYLSLIFIFSVIERTSTLLHTIGAFPTDFVEQLNNDTWLNNSILEVQ